MPHMTGDVLAREMMRIRRDLPVILCSGYSHEISPEQLKEMEIQHFLAKPSTMREMAEIVRTALDRSKNNTIRPKSQD